MSDRDRSNERRNWIAAVGADAMSAGQAAIVRAGFSDPGLLLHWEEIAGPETARLARPVRLSQGQYGGVLTLMTEPAAAVFLQHETRSLCERINTYMGRPVVARLKFVQAALTQRPPPPPPRKVPQTLNPSDPAARYQGPDGLREALWRLARARKSQG